MAIIILGIGAVHAMKSPSIVETAIAANSQGEFAGSFDILIAALQAEENLIKKLSRNGQYTVFAPTNDAFEALFEELGLTPEQVLSDKELLSSVLGYHVTRGNRDSTSLTKSKKIRTLSKNFINIDGIVLTDERNRNSNIIVADIKAGNGVIHVIDKVILPR